MKNIYLISLLFFILIEGCTRSINPEYKPFLEQGTTEEREYNLSSASDTNICRLAELVDRDMRSGQIKNNISKGVDQEIEKRNLDCSKPFPQYERKENAKKDKKDLMEWFGDLIDGEKE